MNCAWDAYMKLIPSRFKRDVEAIGKTDIQELRLRSGQAPELVLKNTSVRLEDFTVVQDDLHYTVNIASRYSPWTSGSIENGYITAQGGHRIGVCGEVAIKEGRIQSVPSVTSVCVRAARDFPGISGNAADMTGSILIIGRPGSGKTTLLRDLVRRISENHDGAVAVVDERREVFPVIAGKFCFPPGPRTDVLSGCPKRTGIDLLLRTMTPKTIAVDEITAQEDCVALKHAAWCGVQLLATAHAATVDDLFHRNVYAPLLKEGIFENLIIIHADKSWTMERMNT